MAVCGYFGGSIPSILVFVKASSLRSLTFFLPPVDFAKELVEEVVVFFLENTELITEAKSHL